MILRRRHPWTIILTCAAGMVTSETRDLKASIEAMDGGAPVQVSCGSWAVVGGDSGAVEIVSEMSFVTSSSRMGLASVGGTTRGQESSEFVLGDVMDSASSNIL